MSDRQIMEMPIKRFWLFSQSIDRMNAAADLRAMRVAGATNSKEAYVSEVGRLNEELGQIAHREYEIDREGVQKLKQLMIPISPESAE